MPVPKASGSFRVLCLGDVVGKGGLAVLRRACPKLREDLQIDLMVANGENAAGGVGIDVASVKDLLAFRIDVVTLGDHVWSKREMASFLENQAADSLPCIRPGNYPEGTPGKGVYIGETASGIRFAVFNLIGRTFSPYFLDCPFRKLDALLKETDPSVRIRILDFHADATSEKVAMGRYGDGRLSLLSGTHTHVQTADAQILPGGTGYITDSGMCGVCDGVIGMDANIALKRFISGMPHSYSAATGRTRLSGVLADIDPGTGLALGIDHINIEVKV